MGSSASTANPIAALLRMCSETIINFSVRLSCVVVRAEIYHVHVV